LSAGLPPTGLAVNDFNKDGRPDLLIGNALGDSLVLLGNGNGTFRDLDRVNKDVRFVVLDISNDGKADDVVLVNAAANQARSLIRKEGSAEFSSSSFVQNRRDGLKDPRSIVHADLNGDEQDDLIIANSGSNSVRVHLANGVGDWQSEAITSFTGTNPVALQPFQLNDDNQDGLIDNGDFPDLAVANEGSNDVSVLLGSGTGAFTLGPRLDVGQVVGPNGLEFRDVVSVDAAGQLVFQPDGVPDLRVSGTNGISVLPGIGSGGLGSGFFNDTAPAFQALPGITQGFTGGNVLTTAGIFAIDNDSTPNLLFASTLITAFTTFTGGMVAASSDDALALLVQEGSGFVEDLVFRDARLSDADTLAVVGDEVYVTVRGVSEPLVFSFSEGIALDPVQSELTARPSFPDLVTLADSTIAVIPFLKRLNREEIVQVEAETDSLDTGGGGEDDELPPLGDAEFPSSLEGLMTDESDLERMRHELRRLDEERDENWDEDTDADLLRHDYRFCPKADPLVPRTRPDQADSQLTPGQTGDEWLRAWLAPEGPYDSQAETSRERLRLHISTEDTDLAQNRPEMPDPAQAPYDTESWLGTSWLKAPALLSLCAAHAWSIRLRRKRVYPPSTGQP
jgi:hypothetical protein